MSDTIRRFVLAGVGLALLEWLWLVRVGVALLEEVCNCGGGL